MDLSIIVVAYNEERNIADCLQSLLGQAYTQGRTEILVVDGGSQDRTLEIVELYRAGSDRIRLIPNARRTIASGRNAGIQAARYPYIVFTDADCVCPPLWLDKLTEGYRRVKRNDARVRAVGGGNTMDHQQGRVPESIAIAFDSMLSALGSVQTKMWDHVRKVESLACLNVLYEASIFAEVGGFDELLRHTGEDWDMSSRIRLAGYTLYYLPDAWVYHKMRANLPQFTRQMFRYGTGRAELIYKHLSVLHWRYAFPLMFILGMAGSLAGFASTSSRWMLLPWLYLPAVMGYAGVLCQRRSRWRNYPSVVLVYWIIHFSYSIGLGLGLLSQGLGQLRTGTEGDADKVEHNVQG